jgi:hypothetical protein
MRNITLCNTPYANTQSAAEETQVLRRKKLSAECNAGNEVAHQYQELKSTVGVPTRHTVCVTTTGY